MLNLLELYLRNFFLSSWKFLNYVTLNLNYDFFIMKEQYKWKLKKSERKRDLNIALVKKMWKQ